MAEDAEKRDPLATPANPPAHPVAPPGAEAAAAPPGDEAARAQPWSAPIRAEAAAGHAPAPGLTLPGSTTPGSAAPGSTTPGATTAAPSLTRDADAPAAAASRPAASGAGRAAPPRASSGWRPLAVVLTLLLVAAGAAYLTRDRWLPMLGLDDGRQAPVAAGRTAAPGPAAPAVPPSSPTTGSAAVPAGAAPSTPPAPGAPVVAATPAPPATSAGADAEAVTAMARQVDDLGGRLASLESSVAALSQAIGALTQAAEAEKATAATMTALDDRVARLERTQIQTSALEGQVRELASKALTLREGFAALNATVLGVSLLARTVNEGEPFVRQLASVRSVASGDPDMAAALAELETHASTGIPTLPALAARFPATADAIARAAATRGGDRWTDRVVDKVTSLVSVRTTGAAAARAGGTDAMLAEAETALAGGDLRAAVTILARLDGPAAAPAAPWLKDAETRLAADRAVATLEEAAAARLARARG